MRPRRIAHLISSGGFYGAEQVVLTLAKNASRLGMIPTILCFEDSRKPSLELLYRAAAEGIEARRLPCRRRLDRATFFDLIESLKELEVDLLHTHGAKADLYGLMAAKQLDLPAVATLHLWTHTPFIVKVHEWLDALMLRFFDRVVAVSNEIGKEMADKGIPRRLIRIIRNGIEVETLGASENGARSEIRREFGIREDAPVVGIVGRLAPEKGHAFFLEAAREVLRFVPDATFVVVGGGLLEGELKAHAERLGFADAVRFAGVRRDIARFYEAFDLLVSSSLREGTPMVLLEAMAMGKAVIATRVGGVPHLVRHDETGLLVPPGNVPVLARAILEMLQDRGRRAKLARAGQRLIREEFSATRMAEAYAKVYEEARALHRTVRRPWATRIVSEG